jgi:hypothetical protein
MDDLVEIRYVGGEDWTVVTRFLATGMCGIEIREIKKSGPELTLINNLDKVYIKERTCNWEEVEPSSACEFTTTCGMDFDPWKNADIKFFKKVTKMNYCPNCGGKLD